MSGELTKTQLLDLADLDEEYGRLTLNGDQPGNWAAFLRQEAARREAEHKPVGGNPPYDFLLDYWSKHHVHVGDGEREGPDSAAAFACPVCHGEAVGSDPHWCPACKPAAADDLVTRLRDLSCDYIGGRINMLATQAADRIEQQARHVEHWRGSFIIEQKANEQLKADKAELVAALREAGAVLQILFQYDNPMTAAERVHSRINEALSKHGGARG